MSNTFTSWVMCKLACAVWPCMWLLCYYVVNRLISDVHVTMWLTCVACCEDTSTVVAWTQWPGCGFQCWSSSPSLAGSCKCWMWFQGKILMHIWSLQIWIIHDRDSYDHCSKCMTVVYFVVWQSWAGISRSWSHHYTWRALNPRAMDEIKDTVGTFWI